MDQESVEEAFSLTTEDGESVPGEFSWQTYSVGTVVFRQDEPLLSGTIYRIHLSTDAMTTDGAYLTDEFESFFGVR